MVASCTHETQLGTWPTTQACALTGNQTGDLLLFMITFNQLSRAGQGIRRSALSERT